MTVSVGEPFTLPAGWEQWPAEAQVQLLGVLRAQVSRFRDRPVGSPGETAVTLNPKGTQQRAHLEVIDRELVRLHNRDSRRLLIVTPPQVGKSSRVGVWFPFWWLGHHPDHRIVLASYADRLARSRGRRVRELVREFGSKYGLILDPSVTAANEWSLLTGGGMYTAGVSGGITGQPADMAIIDDPHKDREEAESIVFRDRVWDFYSATLTPRLAPGAPVVLILTRWHPDDLAGRLLAQEGRTEDGGAWTVVHLPALAMEPERDRSGRMLVGEDPLGREAGDPLPHPKIDVADTAAQLEHWEGRRSSPSTTARDWFALYQGIPRDPEGEIFKAEPIERWRVRVRDDGEYRDRTGACVRLPAWMTVREYIDPSFSDADTADETGRIVIGKGVDARDGRVKAWVLADLSQRRPYDRLEDAVIGDSHATWGTVAVRAEQNMLGQRVLSTIRKNLPSHLQVEGIKAKGSKSLRAENASALVENGLVVFVGEHELLEAQLLTWAPTDSDSPDRLDAFVHGVLDLLATAAESSPGAAVVPMTQRLPAASRLAGGDRGGVMAAPSSTARLPSVWGGSR